MSAQALRVGIDVRLAHWPGIGRYVEEIVGRMVVDYPATEFVLFANPSGPSTLRSYADPLLEQTLQAPNVRFVACKVKPFSGSEPWTLARAVSAEQVMVMHSPYINVPWLGRNGPPLIVTLHDFRHPDLALRADSPRTWSKRAYYEILTRVALARARRVICVSEYLAAQLRQFQPATGRRIVVIPHAASATFSPLPAAEAALAVAKEFGLIGPYFLFVGTLKPHKNLLAVVRALAHPNIAPEVSLAVAAAPDTRYPEVAAEVRRLGLTRRVHFLGHLAKHKLPALYNAARATLLPSAYESFGLPVVESMACGTPVIAAPRASLPEVGGTAAWYAEPEAEPLAAVMLDALTDESQHARRRLAGLERATCFSWQRSAAALHELYRQTAADAAAV